MTLYQLKTIGIGIVIILLCVGGYLLMDKTKENEGFIVMKRNSKGQFQKANAAVTLAEERENNKKGSFLSDLDKAHVEIRPETEIKKNDPKPETEIRHAANSQGFARPNITEFFPKSNSNVFGTNADMIRSMSDDQLAEFLSDIERGSFIKLWLKQKQENNK